MKKIAHTTRRELFDVIMSGFLVRNLTEDEEISEMKMDETGRYEIFMRFCGQKSPTDFLSRLYPLKEMPSYDPRFTNAARDIWQHTEYNDDWSEFWFLSDNRFELDHGFDDEPLLKFICEMLNPTVRVKGSPWKEYLKKFNEILSPDGYELYAAYDILGRDVFKYKEKDGIEFINQEIRVYSSLTLIGEGSYAHVFAFEDKLYNQKFALKRAKKDLDEKELIRFKREYDQMKSFNSSYVLKVHSYNEEKKEYIMEYMDMTLEKYISKNNATLNNEQRKSIISQLTNGYEYLHKRQFFHRDVSSNNVLIREHDDSMTVKISDFGLVKMPNSELTSASTELKGSLNDPSLKIRGFVSYDLLDEIYALTLLFVYVLTGKKKF